MRSIHKIEILIPHQKSHCANQFTSTMRCSNNTCPNPLTIASYRCSKCRGVTYCGEECQQIDWKDHKAVCKSIAILPSVSSSPTPPSSSRPLPISPEEALQLTQSYGTIVCIDVPEGTEVGIDLKSWTTGSKFCGIKMIPPGPHYFCYSSRGRYGDSAVLSGNFIYIELQQVVVLKWDPTIEGFSSRRFSPRRDATAAAPLLSEDDIARYTQGVKSMALDGGLGAYPSEMYAEWKSLSQYITKGVVERFEGSCETIRLDGAALPYLQLPVITKSKDVFPPTSSSAPVTHMISPEEVTSYAVDSSSVMRELPMERIASELQFAFIEFLIGQSFEGLRHWKNLVDMVFRAEGLILITKSHPPIAILLNSTLRIILEQLKRIPRDFFIDELSKDNFMKRSLRFLLSIVSDDRESGSGAKIDSALLSVIQKINSFALEHFMWTYDIEEEDDEDKPVVVMDL